MNIHIQVNMAIHKIYERSYSQRQSTKKIFPHEHRTFMIQRWWVSTITLLCWQARFPRPQLLYQTETFVVVPNPGISDRKTKQYVPPKTTLCINIYFAHSAGTTSLKE